MKGLIVVSQKEAHRANVLQQVDLLVRYCARPPLASGRLGRLNADTLVYSLRRPLLDGRTEILLEPLEFLARLVDLL